MSVSFNTIPGNIRVPLFYAEMDNAQASYFSPKYRALLIGQKLADAPAKTSIPTLISRLDQAKEQYGTGSMLTRMFESYRTNDDLNEVWCVAVDESATGVAAAGKIEIVGTATENGALAVYIAAQRLYIGVTQGDTAGLVATKLATAINALSDLPVTAAAVNTVVNLTAKWKGESGNDINVMMNYLGLAQGEKLPTGLLLTISKMSGGVGYPDLSAVIAKLGDEEYDFIVLPYTDVGSLDAIGLEMNDQTGRWSYGRQ
ncbi:MAG: phage tail protein, partial [Ottowia sp.]|nr:phage tail protein [Ottowia sp.]